MDFIIKVYLLEINNLFLYDFIYFFLFFFIFIMLMERIASFGAQTNKLGKIKIFALLIIFNKSQFADNKEIVILSLFSNL